MKRDLHRLAEDELRRCTPVSQEGCCDVAARVDVAANGRPRSDAEFLDRARGLAAGLFGEAFEITNEGQRWIWCDMCEEALRRASNAEI